MNPADPDATILHTAGALLDLANRPLLLRRHRRALRRIVADLLPAAAAARKMRITLDEMVAEAQESAATAERGAETRVLRVGAPALVVVGGGRE